MSGKYLLGNMLSAIHNKKFFYEKPVVVEYNGLCEDVLKVMESAGYVKDRMSSIRRQRQNEENIELQPICFNDCVYIKRRDPS